MVAKILKNRVDLLQVHLGLKKGWCGRHLWCAPNNQWCNSSCSSTNFTLATPDVSGIFQLMSNSGIWLFFFLFTCGSISIKGSLSSYNLFLENNPVSLAGGGARCNRPKFSPLICFIFEDSYSVSSICYFMVGSET